MAKEIEDSTPKKVSVITTHVNADFDALASMLAAQKLYPDALVVFPGSQEKNLKNFFINSMAYLFNMADINDIDFSEVGQLILVDTRQRGRIGRLTDLLNSTDIDIHIYDHHPPTGNDIKGSLEVHGKTGANVTILTEIIKEKEVQISPDEANVVSDLIARELSPEQVVLLNDMIHAITRYNVSGIEIIVTSITLEKYMPDFAFLVQKMVKMENIDAIFAIARMENKIYVPFWQRSAAVGILMPPPHQSRRKPWLKRKPN